MYRIRQCLLAVQKNVYIDQQAVRTLSSKNVQKKKGDTSKKTQVTKQEPPTEGGHKVQTYDFQHLMSQLENLGRPIEQTKAKTPKDSEMFNLGRKTREPKIDLDDLDKLARAVFEKKKHVQQRQRTEPRQNFEQVEEAVQDIAATDPNFFKSAGGRRYERGEQGRRMGGRRSDFGGDDLLKDIDFKPDRDMQRDRNRLSTDPVVMRVFGRLPPSGDLLEGIKPLNIFNPSKWSERPEAETVKVSEAWKKRFTVDESLIYPKNGFDEMIEWTKQGQMWQYPIDNDQGVDTSETFADHVFLDQHIVDFPDDEAVMAFMELVCIGLSKNPWLTAKEKVDHINWFRDYFHENIDELS